MSRSYKKNPVCVTPGAYGSKRQANKKLRQQRYDRYVGNAYKRVYPSWNIRDWVKRKTEKQAIREAVENGVEDVQEYLDTWYRRWYKSK